jgi:adenylate cyclase
MMPVRTRTPVRVAEGAIAFTDLAGFTEYTAVQGDEAALALLRLQERIVRNEIGERGRIVKNLGDGLLLWFGDACDALRVSITLQEQFERYSTEEDLPLWVRIGVHFGRPARRGRDLIGHDVNVAARIVDLAAPGEVLCSEACAARVTGSLEGMTFEELGPVVMRGIPDPVALYRVHRL